MSSLTARLTIAFLLVGIVAVALVGLLVQWAGASAIDRFVSDRNTVSLSNTLSSYYAANGSWSGVDRLFQQYERSRGAPSGRGPDSLALVDNERKVIYGQGEFAAGQTLSSRVLQGALPIEANNKTVGSLVVREVRTREARLPGTSETLLGQRLSRIIFLSALGAMSLALLVGALLARSLARPISELTAATSAIAQGKLGAQVPVRSRDELGRLAASFNSMSSDLQRANDLRRQMTADVAHDLRTPLSVLLGYTEALHDGKFQGSEPAYAAMHDAAQQLQHLVDDLNTLALADAGELKLARRPTAPEALLERTMRTFSAQAAAQHVTLAVESTGHLPAALPEIDVDPDRMTQVLSNLVANALRYTPDGGRIMLAAQVEGQAVRLSVADTGSGIAAEDLPHVFDRFYRGDRARQTQTGEAGLGLAIARSIVEGHGGTITVVSTIGQGTTFTVTLPAMQAAPGTPRDA